MPVVVIVGPTGIGKTKLSIELAKLLEGEIINADSTQVYKSLDIGTSKVTKEEMQGVKHHLIDFLDVKTDYTVFHYQKDARYIIDSLKTKQKMPIVVGGTGLYIKALLYDYKFNEDKGTLEKYDDVSTEDLFKELLKVSPKTDIHPNNRKRIIRALNYFKETGIDPKEKEVTTKILYNSIVIGLTTDREKLYELINKRVDKMVELGLIEEAKKIYDTNIRTKAVMTPIGYKELFEYFDNKITLEEALEKIKKNSRNYAKKQYTWFKNQMEVEWFDVNFENFDETVMEVYRYIQSKISE